MPTNGEHNQGNEHGSTKVSAATHATAPIAVIGLAGRFPGDATTPRALWEMCCDGQSAWSEIPQDRMNPDAYFHPNPSKPGSFNFKGAHFLREDVGSFDAPFFNISPNEAKRLLLECTYEALENAGATLETTADTPTGVYVGAAQIDYTSLLYKDVDDIPVYQSTGTSANILSKRISYVFDLKGPSITMDTACSSSLAALHTACQSLRAGDISQAIVCGVHVMLNPDTMVGMSMLRGTGYGRGEGVVSLLLKPLDAAIRDGDNIRAIIRNTGINQDGKTNGITFPSCEAQANLMESVYQTAGLDPAETDYIEAHGTGTAAGDPIEAEAISRVFTKCRSSMEPLVVGSVKTNIGHLEAASGLAGVVKTIFALENGVIPPNINFETPNKDIPLADWKLKVPTSLQSWPNPRLRRASISNFGFGGTNAHVILEQYEKDRLQNGPSSTHGINGHNEDDSDYVSELNGRHGGDGNPCINGVSDHTAEKSGESLVSDIINECSEVEEPTKEQQPSTRRLFVLTSKDKISLKRQMEGIASYLSETAKLDDASLMERLAFTLCQRRSILDWREAVSASTPTELCEALSSGTVEPNGPSGTPSLGFVFTGQGAQWHAMGRELHSYPVYASAMKAADGFLREFGAEWSLLDELLKDSESSLVNRPYISQPATTAIQIATVALLASWNIKPVAVVGHSSGEIAAAYATGALSARSCMLIAYQRGVLAETLKEKKPERPGRMLAIGASPAKVRPMVKRLGSAQVVIACVNGPSLITASGDERGISRLQSLTEDESLLNRRLKVDVAYHSPHMNDISSEYLSSIKPIEPQGVDNVAFHSSVRGHRMSTESLNAEYWVENMTSPVQFLDGIQSMYNDRQGPDVLIEVGPHATLESPIRDIMKSNPQWASKVKYFSTLSRGQDASLTTLSLASELFVLGCDLNFTAINHPASTLPAPLTPLGDLPIYPWNHSKWHWHESRLSRNHRLRRFPRSDILGSLVEDYNDLEPRWRNILRISDLPWLSDHKVQGSTIFPLTGYLTMVLEGAYQYALIHKMPINPSARYKLREIKISRPMVLSNDTATEVSLVMRPQREGSRATSKTWNEFSVFSWSQEADWVEHCQGLISLDHGNREPNPINGVRQADSQAAHYQAIIDKHDHSCQKALEPADIYSRFSRGGLDFGPTFRNITAAFAAEGYSRGVVTIPDSAKMMPDAFEKIHIIHPGTFDACFQVTDFAASGGDLSHNDIYVPTFVKNMT
ncbi:MAG: hypothetical protein Q9225_006708, partial [Loekoesia sp. 1 TL-2023]